MPAQSQNTVEPVEDFAAWKVAQEKSIGSLMGEYLGARIEVARKYEAVGSFLIPCKAQFIAQGLKAGDFMTWATKACRQSKSWVNDSMRVAGFVEVLPQELRDVPVEHLSIVASLPEKVATKLLRASEKRTKMTEPERTAKLREEKSAYLTAQGGSDPSVTASRAKATKQEKAQNELRESLRPKVASVMVKVHNGDLTPEEILLVGVELGENFAKAADAAGTKVATILLEVLAEGTEVPEGETIAEDREPVAA